jgi:predicted TIM-barrel fold metal-dependent hydrolase
MTIPRHQIIASVLSLAFALASGFASVLYAGEKAVAAGTERPPIIDMHVHAVVEGGWIKYGVKDFFGNPGAANAEICFKETYERFRKYNVVKAVVSGPLRQVQTWKSRDEDNRIVQGVLVIKPNDRISANDQKIDPVQFEKLVKAGKIEVFGEVIPLLAGMTICDPEWQPYLKICEQYDIPLCLHTGGGPPDAQLTFAPKTRYRLGDPYLIEDVLVRYPKLRVYMCHAGGEWHEHTLVMMQSYPQLYTDLGAYLWACPLIKRYAREFLANAKEAGFLDRVMFGSDQEIWPHAIEMSIDYLNSLDFLTEEDKRDILYNNAARFLRLKE